VSHEFRTPLTTILASAELLNTCGENLSIQEQKRRYQRIQNGALQMAEMLEMVLTLHEAETGGLEFHLTLLNLRDFCQDLIRQLRQRFGVGDGSPEVGAIRSLEEELEMSEVYLDGRLLEAILSQLVGNALKYSATESEIEFAYRSGRETVTFEIRDRGLGIPPAEQELVFAPFQRGSNVNHTRGMGLGLAIVKYCVELHGGRIELMSELSKGTTVRVTLPNRLGN